MLNFTQSITSAVGGLNIWNLELSIREFLVCLQVSLRQILALLLLLFFGPSEESTAWPICRTFVYLNFPSYSDCDSLTLAQIRNVLLERRGGQKTVL